MTSTTIEFRVHLKNGNRGHRRLREGRPPAARPVEPGRVPRISRLMALAIKIDKMIASDAIAGLAQAARLGHVSRARLSQIMNLTLLAPDIIEEVLHLPRTMSGRDVITERMVRPVAAVADWGEQRRRWAVCQGWNPEGGHEASLLPLDGTRGACPTLPAKIS